MPALIGSARPGTDQALQSRRRAMLEQLCSLVGGRSIDEVAGIECRYLLTRGAARIFLLHGAKLELWEEVRHTWRGDVSTFTIYGCATWDPR